MSNMFYHVLKGKYTDKQPLHGPPKQQAMVFGTYGVIQHLFKWQEPKPKPTEQDIVNLLSTKFTLRVDLDRKILEHAAPADTDTHPEPEEEESNSKKVKTA